MANIENKQIF